MIVSRMHDGKAQGENLGMSLRPRGIENQQGARDAFRGDARDGLLNAGIVRLGKREASRRLRSANAQPREETHVRGNLALSAAATGGGTKPLTLP